MAKFAVRASLDGSFAVSCIIVLGTFSARSSHRFAMSGCIAIFITFITSPDFCIDIDWYYFDFLLACGIFTLYTASSLTLGELKNSLM